MELKVNKKDGYFYNVRVGRYGILGKDILGDVGIKEVGEKEFKRKKGMG
ncbi:hypothetical protein [Bacillus sp. WP8]|nr:hypothetical protein [Bacillus sp. WP8]